MVDKKNDKNEDKIKEDDKKSQELEVGKKETDEKKIGFEVKKEDRKNIDNSKKDVEESLSLNLDEEDDERENKNNNIDSLDDLPEEVRKKLEKGKVEKTKKKQVKKRKKKIIKKVSVGRAYVQATYNNTMVTLTDLNGDVISWANAGVAGFKGPKKATSYAAQIITKIAVFKAKEFGLKEVSVFVKGVGVGRESAVRSLNANGLNITSIKDITPIPHNGCRSRKPRRV